MRVRVGALSDVGRQRAHNEDALAVVADLHLYVLADGMGGHSAGEVAARLAIEAIVDHVRGARDTDCTPHPGPNDPRESSEEHLLRSAITTANRAVIGRSVGATSGMGTTVVAALLSPEQRRIHVAHVGDSRCYRLRDGELTLLTRDHSLTQEYRDARPDASDDDIAFVPPNVITRAVGISDEVQTDVVIDTLATGDRFVLCSDGLSGMVTDAEIHALASAPGDPQRIAETLVERANERGGDDNVTVIVLAVD